MKRLYRVLTVLIALVFLQGAGAITHAQKALTPEEFDKLSLQYRTALHYDPLIDAPLDALVRMYVGAERVDELIGTYRSHIEQYPQDAGAKATLIRILKKVDREGADELVSSAVQLLPESAPLQYLYFRFLEEKGDPRATEALARAIQLESNLARKRKWLDDLLQLSDNEETRAIAETQLEAILSNESLTAESLLELARLAQRYQFWKRSAEALNRAKAAGLGAEDAVEADLLLATSLSETGNHAEAGRILDALLSKLAPDHWRRRELMSLRVSVVASAKQRKELLDRFRKDYEEKPEDEGRVLDYAEVLVAAEKHTEAVKVLVTSADVLPKSARVEVRAIELLESLGDYPATKSFLERRLEEEPERSDLRFKLVKADYALGNDADADQEFRTVVAGLQPEEASEKIMELQRFLRSIDRIEAAGKYLERYVRNFPSRLDVAGELLEIYLATDNGDSVPDLVAQLDIQEAAVEEVIDLAEFLISRGYPVPARDILVSAIAKAPSNFDLGLLLIKVLGTLGDRSGGERQIARLREAADTTARYKAWLDTAVTANEKFETLPRFFDEEQNRFTFSDNSWSEDKIEKFLLLGEAGKRAMQTGRIEQEVRERLRQSGLDPLLKVRLRKFLVGLLAGQSGNEGEIEEQLKILEREDAENAANYQLTRVILYYKGQRLDLAGQLLNAVDYQQISSVKLLSDVVPILIEFEFFQKAEEALSVINQLAPEDVFSWEKRLSLLAAMGEEKSFRSVIRALRNGDAGMKFRNLSRESLLDHLVASYWRSIAQLLSERSTTNLEEVLPMLASVEREANAPLTHLWTEWCRAYVLSSLSRIEEAASALDRFRAIASRQKLEDVHFPDGLRLSVSAAPSLLRNFSNNTEADESAKDASFLLSGVEMNWAFEVSPGAELSSFHESENYVVALDTNGTVYSIDLDTGKLVWREQFRSKTIGGSGDAAQLFEDRGFATPFLGENLSVHEAGRAGAGFSVAGGRAFLIRDRELVAFSVADGDILWVGDLPGDGLTSSSLQNIHLEANEKFSVVLDIDAQILSCFDNETGKILWRRDDKSVESIESGISPLNTGVSLSDGLVFVYGFDPGIYLVESGEPVWSFGDIPEISFPIVLREAKGESEIAVVDLDSSDEVQTNGWQDGAGIEALVDTRQLLDYFSPTADRKLVAEGAFNESTSMVGPAVFWAGHRVGSSSTAQAVLSDDNLWLMGDSSIRKISTNLPIASSELPISGILVGAFGNHVWSMDGSYLVHGDFFRERVSRISLAKLGNPQQVHSSVAGNQIIVRGRGGLVVLNALTGTILGTSVWPESLVDYLDEGLTQEQEFVGTAVWQGWVINHTGNKPGYLFPVEDRVVGNRYLTSFGRNCIVCVGASKEAGTPSKTQPK